MKRFFVRLVVVLFLLSFAGFAFAGGSDQGDIGIKISDSNTSYNDNYNKNKNYNDNFNYNKNKNYNENDNASTAVVEDARDFMNVGFNGLQTPGVGVAAGKWRTYCPAVYNPWAPQDFQIAQPPFRFYDFITFNWKSDFEFTPTSAKVNDANDDAVYCVNYWPKDASMPGDRILGSVRVKGNVDFMGDAYVARAYAVCKEKTGSRRIAVQVKDVPKTMTDTASFNTSLTSGIVDGNVAGAVAGGMGFGHAGVYIDQFSEIEALCLNDGPTARPPQKKAKKLPPPPPPASEEPKPLTCSSVEIDAIFKEITRLDLAIIDCTNWGWDNFNLRKAAYQKKIDLYVCTRNKRYLREARVHFKKLVDNYRHPDAQASIRPHQAEADKIMAKGIKDWVVATKRTEGIKAARILIKENNLDVVDPSQLPSDFTLR